MRKNTVILLTFIMILGLCACSAKEPQNPAPADETAPEIVTHVIEAPSTTGDGEAAEAPAERVAFDFDTKTVTLNSGYEMPILGIGTYALSDEQAENSVYWALRDGYRMIDTARIYGNETGVGRGIRRAINEGIVKREDIFVTTKMWTSDYDDGERGNTQTLFNDETISGIAAAHGKTSAQIILRWHLQAGNIAIPGSSNEAHIAENYDIFDFALSADEMAQLTALDKNQRFANY